MRPPANTDDWDGGDWAEWHGEHDAEDALDDEYVLDNRPAPAPKPAPLPPPVETQGKLFSGLDLLPGQKDLFATDGALK